jgi:predicted transcriptional regulator
MHCGGEGAMTPPRAPHPRHVRYSVRHQARLDAETHAKLEKLAHTFHRKLSAILRYVMQWGLTHGQAWTIDRSIPAMVHMVAMLVEPGLLQQVQDAAATHGVTVAAWVHHALRQVTLDDFPASWHAEAAQDDQRRSHDSRRYGIRFLLRLDDETSNTLGLLTRTFARSAAEVIRHLIAQATPEDFPQSWRLAAAAHRPQDARPAHRGTP